MRFVNAAIGINFKLSIDQHKFKVISTDFVPIHPYETNSLYLGIGEMDPRFLLQELVHDGGIEPRITEMFCDMLISAG